MPGRDTSLVTGNYYHIFNRGITSQQTFIKPLHYSRFISVLDYYRPLNRPLRFSQFIQLSHIKQAEKLLFQDVSDFHVTLISYCLMPNHFHLLVKQTFDDGVSKYLSLISNSYSRYFNTVNRRIGPLFQGKFKSVHVENQEQLIHLSRYIHLNPYSAGLVNSFEDLKKYPYSSFIEYINMPQTCNPHDVISLFKSKDDYMKFVLNNADYQRQLQTIKHLLLDI